MSGRTGTTDVPDAAPPTRQHHQAYRLPRRGVAVVLTLGLAQVASLVAFLLLTRAVVNRMVPTVVGADLAVFHQQTAWQLGGLAGLALVHGLLRYAEFSVSETIGYNVVRDLRMGMYEHLQGMTSEQLQHRARGGLLLRFIGDLSMLRMWISRGLLGGSVALMVVTGAVLTLTVLDPWLGLSIAAVMFLGAALSVTRGKAMRRATRTMRRRRSLVTGNIDEQINALEVVQVFGRASGEHARLSRQNDVLNASLVSMARLRGQLRGIASSAALVAVVVVLGIGLLEVQHGTTSVGLVVGAMIVTRQLQSPLRALGLAHDYWHRGQVSRQKIDDYLRSSSQGLERDGEEALRLTRGEVELRGVAVHGLLPRVDAVAPRRSRIVVTGAMGTGKSTLLRLVARLAEPTSGSVLVDGQDLAAVSRRSTFRYVGVVSPDLPLMRGSVRRNLTYSRPDVAPEEVDRLLALTGLDLLVDRLPQGLDSWVTEGGRNLSSAERQVIALARALLGNPPVLLLDEPFTHLDDRTRAEMRRVVSRHQGTVLLVSHDPQDAALADQVWHLSREDGLEQLSPAEHAQRNREARRADRWNHVAS